MYDGVNPNLFYIKCFFIVNNKIFRIFAKRLQMIPVFEKVEVFLTNKPLTQHIKTYRNAKVTINGNNLIITVNDTEPDDNMYVSINTVFSLDNVGWYKTYQKIKIK